MAPRKLPNIDQPSISEAATAARTSGGVRSAVPAEPAEPADSPGLFAEPAISTRASMTGWVSTRWMSPSMIRRARMAAESGASRV
ncbi:MAG TPA: hypothetical protein ENI86_06335 [Acidimicrobiales bacterium]|nr:hypothetical protein [Acidimicrobiales bacterium]